MPEVSDKQLLGTLAGNVIQCRKGALSVFLSAKVELRFRIGKGEVEGLAFHLLPPFHATAFAFDDFTNALRSSMSKRTRLPIFTAAISRAATRS